MATKSNSDKKPAPKKARRNTRVAVDLAVGDVLDPVLKKRGFASREIIERWDVIAPPPYNTQSLPDQLTWGRNQDAATLVLRCTAGLKLLAAHDAPMIVRSVNRYFGYVLVEHVRLSAGLFTPHSRQDEETEPELSHSEQEWVRSTVGEVDDEDLRRALTRLGQGIKRQKS